MNWNDDIKKIIELMPKIDAIQSNANPVAGYDDSQIKAEIKSLGALLGELHDDVLRIKRAESSERTSQELAENFEHELLSVNKKLKAMKTPEVYDDGELKREIARLSGLIPNQYDDKDLIKRLSKLEQVKPQKYDDKWIKGELESIKSRLISAYDDKEIKLQVKKLADSKPEKYNDTEIKKEIKALREVASRKCDDSVIKKELQSLRKLIPEAYDDLVIHKKLNEVKSLIPAPYDDSIIKKKLKEVESSIPKTYDDAEIKSAISQLLKLCESQNVTIATLSKECGKINGLVNLVGERDKTISDLKLDLKRAESSARNCEELMINMERKVNELSVRLNNGN